jgi:hypothetical protein
MRRCLSTRSVGVTEESPMRHPNYTNDRWFMRTARTLPVVAMAALFGGVIGGFSVYAVILALTETPNADIVAMKAGATQSVDSRPQNAASAIRTIGTPPPNVTEAPALPAQPPQQAQAAPVPPQTPTSQNPAPQNPAPQTPAFQTPASQTPWPDALSRASPTSPETAVTPPVSASAAGSENVNAAPTKPVPPRPSPQKRRVVSRKPSPAPYQSTPYQSNGETAARSQPVYDYYNDNNRYGDNRWGDNRYNDHRYGDTTSVPRGVNGGTRIVVRRQMVPPAQPAPPG